MSPFQQDPAFQAALVDPTPDSELEYYLSHAYHDMRFFFRSISHHQAITFFYFGDMQSGLFYISDNMRDTFGFEHNLIPDFLTKWKTVIHGARSQALLDEDFDRILRTKAEIHDLRYQVRDKYGKVFWIRCCGSFKWNEDQTKPLFFSGRVTRQDETFTVDPVTNFPSTDTLQRHLKLLAASHQTWRTLGFRFNNIPQINTMYGRNIANAMIRDICSQLMDDMGDELNFYRLPGVRCMALINPSCTLSNQEIIQKIQTIAAAGYDALDVPVITPCSFAVMQFPQHDTSPETFLESMVSLIKIAHHEPTLPYAEDTAQNIQKIHSMSNLELTISQNVLHNMENFRAVIQPIVSAETGRITSGETLMRWKYEGKDVSPGVFIPALEKNRMIFIAGKWILEQAVSACARIIRHLPDFYLSVNLSLQQLYDQELMDFIPQVLEQYHLDGKHLVVEITESCMDMEPAKLNKLMSMCQKIGVRIALDDFGTGYSSLRVLLQYPTNIIKLDRSLLLEMTESQDKSNFINSIVFACHKFGKTVCMEGVEDETQHSITQDAKCDMIQGFYFYRPTELEEIYQIVESEGKKYTK